MARITREYRPTRYVASVERHAVPRDAVTGDSFDWLFDPQERAMVRRFGSEIQGDVTPGSVGLFESKWSARARQMIEIHSQSLTDSYATWCGLWTNETSGKGSVLLRSTNGGGLNYQLGEEFGSTHYPTLTTGSGGSIPKWICVPLKTGDSTTKFTRGINSTQRSFFTGGARRMHEVGDYLYVPSSEGTPMKWNKRFNDSSGSGSEINRVSPWGNYPPLFPPLYGSATAAGTSDANWEDGDTFYVSVMFEYRDGSFSPPWIPRTKGVSGLTAAQAGLITVGTVGGTAKYSKITLTSLAIGGPDVVRRWILTSPKQKLAATSDTLTIDPLDFRVADIIGNNEYTTVYLYSVGESTDNIRIRLDQQWPHRTQYVCGADQRVIIGGKMRMNQAAIILAPTGYAASLDQNHSDQYAVGANWSLVRITGTSLQLRYLSAIAGAPATTTITLSATKSLQDIVDEINATVFGGSGKEWKAQLAPGTDGGIVSTWLMDTTGQDFGDDTGIVSDATTGNIRAWGPNYPAVLYLSDSFTNQFQPDEQGIRFTGGGPGAPVSAANNFYAGNYRFPPNRRVGKLVGMASITPTNGIVAIICYERGIYVFRNIRGGGTGEDDDYRLLPLNESRGCISFSSITEGNGWVGYMTRDGYVITDGEREINISLDLWNAEKSSGAGVGVWQYEVNASVAATAKGGDDTYFHASVFGSRLRINYRSDSSSSTIGNRGVVYDFSGSPATNGIAEMLTQDGVPFGWSCPIRQQLGPMCRVSKSGGWQMFAAMDKADSSFTTGSGRVDRFDYGDNDNLVAINSLAYLPTDPCDSPSYKIPREATILSANLDSGLTFWMYANHTRTGVTAITAPAVGSNIFSRKNSPLDNTLQVRCEAFEVRIIDDGTSSGEPRPKVWAVWIDADVLESAR